MKIVTQYQMPTPEEPATFTGKEVLGLVVGALVFGPALPGLVPVVGGVLAIGAAAGLAVRGAAKTLQFFRSHRI